MTHDPRALLGGFWLRGDCSALLLPWFRTDQRQSATGIKPLSTLESFFLAVGFELKGGGAVVGVDDEFVEQAHDYRVGTWS